MSTLHVISHSPFSDNRLYSCLRLLGPHDGLLVAGAEVGEAGPLGHPVPADVVEQRRLQAAE